MNVDTLSAQKVAVSKHTTHVGVLRQEYGGAGIVAVSLINQMSPVLVLAAQVAIFGVAALRTRVVGLVVAGATAILLCSITWAEAGGPMTEPRVIMGFVLSALSFACGRAVRSHRAMVAALADRARRASEIAALLRNAAGAIGALFALLLLAPTLLSAILPSSWEDHILPYLPSNAGSSFTSVVPPDGMLSAGAGAAVLAGWVVVLLGAAAILLRRRDA